MDGNKGATLEDVSGTTDHSQPMKGGIIRREVDSLDDFEHLGHDDNSPSKETTNNSSIARDVINIGVGLANTATSKSTTNNQHQDELSSFDPFTSSSLPQPPPAPSANKMDSNLLEMGDHFPDRKEADDKIDKFLQEMSSFAPKHEEQPELRDKNDFAFKVSTQNFMDAERGPLPAKKPTPVVDQLDKYSDGEDDDFKPSKYEDFSKKAELPESFGSFDNFKNDTFKDVEEPSPHDDGKVSPIIPPSNTQKEEKILEPVEVPTPEPPPKLPEIQPEVLNKIPEKTETSKATKSNVIDAEAIFCRMGLDTWFNPERLNPKVESLIYWRDPKKSGLVFGGVLLILLSLTYFSLISVVAYLSLIALTGTISFRIYKNIVQAVQKTGDGHPFKDLLEYDAALPQEKVKDISEIAVAHINAGVSELRRLFLVEDLVDSIKFGVLLWTLTYLGAWFNGMTLIIIAWVALFTLPKVYETNKTQIDANLEIVRTKLAEITSKVKAAIPIGKKAEEKKEQ